MPDTELSKLFKKSVMSDQIQKKASRNKLIIAKDNGEQAAFSRPETEFTSSQFGLSKREYLAAAAMQGLIAGYSGLSNITPDEVVEEAVNLADLLLIELESTK